MYGLKFIDAYNDYIVVGAEFEVKKKDKSERYKYTTGPESTILEKVGKCNWEKIIKRAKPEDVEAILNENDSGHEWTYQEFLLALTFYVQGKKDGGT